MYGVTQRGPISTTILSSILGAVVRACVLEVCYPKFTDKELGREVGGGGISFIVNYGRILRGGAEQVNHVIGSLVALFERLVFQIKGNETKAIFCTP